MLEAYLPTDELIVYYECSDYPFNFDFITRLPTGVPVTAQGIYDIISDWTGSSTEGKVVNWVVGMLDTL